LSLLFPLIFAVEVKGPGDTLSSTQKVWIDVMLSAGIEVEVSPSSLFDLVLVDIPCLTPSS
jgi:hypothetical protein